MAGDGREELPNEESAACGLIHRDPALNAAATLQRGCEWSEQEAWMH